jgi:hypothetical protein
VKRHSPQPSEERDHTEDKSQQEKKTGLDGFLLDGIMDGFERKGLELSKK